MTKESVKNNETLIEINARMFASAASIAPVSDFRHYLNGIHITQAKQGGINIVATDAYRLIFLWDKDGFSSIDEVILPKRELKELIKLSRSPKNKNKIIKIKNHKDYFLASLSRSNFKFNSIDGKFPTFNEVVASNINDSSYIGNSTLYRAKYISDFKYILHNKKYPSKEHIGIHFGRDGAFCAASKYGFYLTLPYHSNNEYPYKNMIDFIFDIIKKPNDDILLKALHKAKRVEGCRFMEDILNIDANIIKNSFNP